MFGCWSGGGAPGELAPGPRRPHPCGKDIMVFSLADFMGYAMTVISAVEHLNIDSDFDKWQVSLDGFDSVSGRYSVSFRKDIKAGKPLSVKPKKQNRPI